MQLHEIKNDIAKILYTTSENHLLLADFLLIEDVNQSLIAQIIDIESTDKTNTNIATVKFSLSINKNANLSTYNGYTPSKDASIIYIDPHEIAQLIQSANANIYWGNLASHPDTEINLGLSLLREKPYIQCDKIENETIITTNILYSLQNCRKRTVIIDFDGRYKKVEDATRLTVSREYRLPLNFNAFDFIAENDLQDCPAENKAIIQGILLELQSYVDTLEDKFIPFDLFKSVIDEQCRQNPIPELIMFKNKLVKYQQKSLFAQEKEQFDFLDKVLSKNSITIIDASGIDEKWHRFIIETVASQIQKKCYFVVNLSDINSTKATLNALYDNELIRPIPISAYKYSLLNELKALCKNLILFAPLEKTNDFEVYNSFLHKLNQKEFIIWSENTFFMPLILKLKAFTKETFAPIVEEQIKADIDSIFTAQGSDSTDSEVVTAPLPVEIPLEQPSEASEITAEETNDEAIEKPVDEIQTTEPVEEILSSEPIEEPADEIIESIDQEEETEIFNEPIDEPTSFDEQSEDDPFIKEAVEQIEEHSEIEHEEVKETIQQEIEEENLPVIDDITEDDLDYLDEVNSTIINNTIESNEEFAIIEDEEEPILQFNQPIEEESIPQFVMSEEEVEENFVQTEDDEEYIAQSLVRQEPQNIEIEQEPSMEKFEEPIFEQQAPQQIFQQEEVEIEQIQQIQDPQQTPVQEEFIEPQVQPQIMQEIEPEPVVEPEPIVQIQEQAPVQTVVPQPTNVQEIPQAPVQTVTAPPEPKPVPKKQAVPVYEAKIADTPMDKDTFKEGNFVYHAKYGKGVVEKIITYGNKTLCSIQFDNVGRRLLDPNLAGLKLV